MDENQQKGNVVSVFYVSRKHAKRVKTALEATSTLNKDFRLTSSTDERFPQAIAVPLRSIPGEIKEELDFISDKDVIIGTGKQFCPFSTSVLGSHVNRQQRLQGNVASPFDRPTIVQSALLLALKEAQRKTSRLSDKDILQQIRSLSITCCPRSLELLGDDDTVVIPRRSLTTDSAEFRDFLSSRIEGGTPADLQRFEELLWKYLAGLYKSPRVVRRGEVDPNSKVRESSYRLLWPFSGIPDTIGSGSPAWITVTEQGIRQSFDMTRVMFSRGNVTEKIRFGKLVQRDEIVLDLYAGIGYFSLPALVHGHAQHLYACEWNEYAAAALRYNLVDNKVNERATVLVGDCRELAKDHMLVDVCDRVSLGLLPSSEGGWKTAVNALRAVTGGWLHVHGNVPAKEIDLWGKWMCLQLLGFVEERGLADQWVVLLGHVQKVKSFAPNVNHYVADVFLGQPQDAPFPNTGFNLNAGEAAIVVGGLNIEKVDAATVSVPSSALADDGVLHQAWMRDSSGSRDKK